MKEFDTITAISTNLGESGIAIIRVSGNNALNLVDSIFKSKSGKSLLDMKTYTMRYGYIIDRESNENIDEVIVSYMKGPRSFTCEDVVEINCHGGVVSTNRVLEEVIKAGARIAEPGEFTKRAFLNGRIDLTQAEGIIDIIRAKTELSMKSALSQSEGRLSKEIKKLRGELLNIIAQIEAVVDYPEDDLEDVTSEQVEKSVDALLEKINMLLKTANEGKILREGLNIAIVGKPNVGKSSLLNALLMEKRAIVTEIPGTTRDVIEEYISVNGVPIKIIDTAGIRETEDIVEKIGVKKSIEKIEEADLIIFVVDLSEELDDEDKYIMDFIKDKKHIIILNKSDLSERLDRGKFNDIDDQYVLKVSAKKGEGLEEVKALIINMFFKGEINKEEVTITNTRHKEALLRAKESLLSAKNVLENTLAIDLASIDIRNSWIRLGEITGETLEEDIIDKIFSEFCLGK